MNLRVIYIKIAFNVMGMEIIYNEKRGLRINPGNFSELASEYKR